LDKHINIYSKNNKKSVILSKNVTLERKERAGKKSHIESLFVREEKLYPLKGEFF
jgi:hypothetical protein